MTKGGAKGGARGQKTCYNCGSEDHAARDCKEPNSNFKFAVCFTCGETGHLVRACPKNKNGIYINGGACKICKGTDHLAKDCPSNGKCLRCGGEGHVSAECSMKFQQNAVPSGKKKSFSGGPTHGDGVDKTRSGGDDLEDDFEDELGDALCRRVVENVGDEGGAEGDDEDGAAAEDLEWETEGTEQVLKDYSSSKKKTKKRGADEKVGGDGGKKGKKPKVVEF